MLRRKFGEAGLAGTSTGTFRLLRDGNRADRLSEVASGVVAGGAASATVTLGRGAAVPAAGARTELARAAGLGEGGFAPPFPPAADAAVVVVVAATEERAGVE